MNAHPHHHTLTQRLVLLFLVATLLATVGIGCNTAKGFGKDVEKAGFGLWGIYAQRSTLN